MNDRQIKRIKKEMRPDPKVIDELFEKVELLETKKKNHGWAKPAVVMSLLVCSVFGAKFILDGKNNGSDEVVSTVRGLPAYEFFDSSGVVDFSRATPFESDITGFLRGDVSVVLVRVDEVDNKVSDNTGFSLQDIKATVLTHVRGEILDPNLEFTNYLIENTTSVWSEYTQEVPMREGGVYILPLQKIDEGGYYHIGTHDYLFEVDDNGKIYSQSHFKPLIAYDGLLVQDFIEFLELLSKDEVYINNLKLAKILENNNVLHVSEYTLISEKPIDYGKTEYIYKATIDDFLGLEKMGDVEVYSESDDPRILDMFVIKSHNFGDYFFDISLSELKSLSKDDEKNDTDFLDLIKEIQGSIRKNNEFLQTKKS